MRLLFVLLLVAYVAALCVSERYVVFSASYQLPDYIDVVDVLFFDKWNLSLVSRVVWTGGGGLLGRGDCATHGDVYYVPVGSQIFAVAPSGVLRRVELHGERVYGVVYTCGEVVSISGNSSHVVLRAFTPDLALLRTLAWEADAGSIYSIAASGCDVVVLAQGIGSTSVYYIANWTVAYVGWLNEPGNLIRDVNGSVYLITERFLYKVSRSGISRLWPSGVSPNFVNAFGMRGTIYVVEGGRLIVLRPGGIREDIYGWSSHGFGTDGTAFYRVSYGWVMHRYDWVLHRYGYIPNVTLRVGVKAAGDDPMIRIGVREIGESSGGSFGPVRVFPGVYMAYLSYCGREISRTVVVVDGADVYVEMPYDFVTLSLEAVDFWGRPVNSPALIVINRQCVHLSPQSKVTFSLPKGVDYVVMYCVRTAVRDVGRYSEEPRCEYIKVKSWDSGLTLVSSSDFHSFGIGGGRYVMRIDGVYYPELVAIALVLGLLYVGDRLMRRWRAQPPGASS